AQPLTRLVPLDQVGQQPGDRGEVLLVLGPGTLGVHGRQVGAVPGVGVVALVVIVGGHRARIGGVTTEPTPSLTARHAADWARVAVQVLQTPYPYAPGH